MSQSQILVLSITTVINAALWNCCKEGIIYNYLHVFKKPANDSLYMYIGNVNSWEFVIITPVCNRVRYYASGDSFLCDSL